MQPTSPMTRDAPMPTIRMIVASCPDEESNSSVAAALPLFLNVVGQVPKIVERILFCKIKTGAQDRSSCFTPLSTCIGHKIDASCFVKQELVGTNCVYVSAGIYVLLRSMHRTDPALSLVLFTLACSSYTLK